MTTPPLAQPFRDDTGEPVRITALYRFVRVADCAALRAELQALCLGQGLKGTLLVAPEGLNGTVAGDHAAVEALLSRLRADPRFAGIRYRDAFARDVPFHRMKVRLKREIVTLGVEGVDPNAAVGTYVDARDWNALIRQPDVLLIDTRNRYEYECGTFEGAVDPGTRSFREFPRRFRDLGIDDPGARRIAMFCTGGIRCEKATAWLRGQGFEQVYQLEGGILSYLETVPAERSLWRGECFVFDSRVTVRHGLEPGSFDMCHACRMPLSEADKQSPRFVPGVSCPRCHATLTEDRRRRFGERQRQVELARARARDHIGSQPPRPVERALGND